MTPDRARDALLARCVAGDCNHETAAELLGMSKASAGKLIRRHQAKRLALMTLASAFHKAFPECNPALRKRHVETGLRTDPMLRPYRPAPCRTYTAEEAANLPPAQPHLQASREPESGLMSYNTNNRADDFMRAMRRRHQPADHEPQLDHEPPLETSGPEFEFELEQVA